MKLTFLGSLVSSFFLRSILTLDKYNGRQTFLTGQFLGKSNFMVSKLSQEVNFQNFMRCLGLKMIAAKVPMSLYHKFGKCLPLVSFVSHCFPFLCLGGLQLFSTKCEEISSWNLQRQCIKCRVTNVSSVTLNS